MERVEKLLVALDLGPAGRALTTGSRRALDRAAWLAKRLEASLTLLHADHPDEYWDAAAGEFVNSTAPEVASEQVLAESVVALRAQGIDVRLEVREESPSMAIVREVLRDGIDLVVGAKRTEVDPGGRKLGSVARQLLRQCPCPVWLENPGDASPPASILAATDLTPVGDRAVELAAWLAEAWGAELHVVHAFSLPITVQMEGGASREEYEKTQKKVSAEQITRVVAATRATKAPKLHIGLTSATRAILEGVEKLRPGLLAMGTVSRGGIPGLLVGNTAERLLDRVDCSLLVVKPDDFVCPVDSSDPA